MDRNETLPPFHGCIEQYIALDFLAIQAQIDACGEFLDLLLLFTDRCLKLINGNFFCTTSSPISCSNRACCFPSSANSGSVNGRSIDVVTVPILNELA